MPEYVMPKSIELLNYTVRKKSTAILKNERIKIKNKLPHTTGFLDVKRYELHILKQFRTIIENDDSINPLVEKIDNLSIGIFH
jgi:hypothetical protein